MKLDDDIEAVRGIEGICEVVSRTYEDRGYPSAICRGNVEARAHLLEAGARWYPSAICRGNVEAVRNNVPDAATVMSGIPRLSAEVTLKPG